MDDSVYGFKGGRPGAIGGVGRTLRTAVGALLAEQTQRLQRSRLRFLLLIVGWCLESRFQRWGANVRFPSVWRGFGSPQHQERTAVSRGGGGRFLLGKNEDLRQRTDNNDLAVKCASPRFRLIR
jgi:hypothetical protein